eukprot:g3812.t1
MSFTGRRTIGLPTVLLHEGEAHVITVELKNGNTYRGLLEESEDNWNMLLSSVELTRGDGRQAKLTHIYLRGEHIRFVCLPPMLHNAPMFKRIFELKKSGKQPLGFGRGRFVGATGGLGRGFGRGRGRGGGRGGFARGGGFRNR